MQAPHRIETQARMKCQCAMLRNKHRCGAEVEDIANDTLSEHQGGPVGAVEEEAAALACI